MNTTRKTMRRFAVGGTMLSWMCAASASGQISHVTATGSFSPDGSSSRPYSLVEDASCGTPDGGEVQIHAGVYHQQGSFYEQVRLTSSGGIARIGDLPADSTTFRVVSYNGHLFGLEIQRLIDAVLDATSALPIFGDLLAEWIDEQIAETEWQDPFRASRMAPLLAAELADVVGMQEVWDPGLLPILVNGYQPADQMYENYREFEVYTILGFIDIPIPFALNSGLLTLSPRELINKEHFTFTAEQEFMETLATKGFQQCTVVKDGFSVGFFNAHTQSGDAQDVSGTRVVQLMQMAIRIEQYRIQHPSHVVIATGDFNVIGGDAEYLQQMYGALGSGQQLPFPLNAYHAAVLDDAGANLECSPEGESCTSCQGNGLRLYFNPSDDSNKRLDYFLYSDSLDGTTKIMPTSYERREYQVPQGQATPCQNGYCTRDLSDHYGIVGNFKLYR